MNIRWLGHSSFCFTESTGTTVVTDPFDPYVGIKMPETQANIVTTSHAHKDHSSAHLVGGNPVVIDKACFVDLQGIHILGIKSFHDEEKGKLRGENVIFKFRIDGVDVCHMGDIGQKCTPELIDAIGPVDVLLIPVGGNYTIDSLEAKEFVDRLMPDIVVPMHYKSKGVEFDIDKVDAFLKLFSNEVIEELSTDNFDITRSETGAEYTRVVLPKLNH